MKAIHFEFPLDGDVLLDGVDGAPSEGCLTVAARVAGGDSVSVNGVAARREGEAWVCPVSLKPGRNTLIARSGSDEARVRALYWPGACGRYRFTVDDCIRCFEDLNAHDYASIFENPYLALWKRAHDLYGSRVHINAFERSVDGAFDLSMMTDRYRDEFIRNSDWLSITFHSVEDRAVKETFAELAAGCVCPKDLPVCVCGRRPEIKLITKKPLTPGAEELAANGRSHSAKLRIVEKTGVGSDPLYRPRI